ncbi:MAG: hypothetical protein R3D51_07905 [Hyphomicrobiaceae bacterium]
MADSNADKLERIRKILVLRERRARREAARLASGITAGTALRSDLLLREHRLEFADLTLRSVARTVDILDRGLRVLHQQNAEAMAKANRASQACNRLVDRLEEHRLDVEREQDEMATTELVSSQGTFVHRTRLR